MENFGRRTWEAALKKAGRDLQATLDTAAAAHQGPRKVNWGPWEFVQTLGAAADHMVALQEKRDWVLRAALANQLLVFRPSAEGNLVCVDNDLTLQAEGLKRNPPTRGLRPELCEARVLEATTRGLTTFPKPAWEALDDLGDFRQVAPPQGDDDPENTLALPLAQLDLSEKQAFMLRPIQDRVKDLQFSAETVAQVKSLAERQRNRRKIKGRWSSLLAKRHLQHHTSAWRQKLDDAGRDIQKFTRCHRPVVHGAKSLRNLAKTLKHKRFLKKTRATLKNQKNQDNPPQVVDQDVKDHPYVNQEVRVIAQGHDLKGLVGHVNKVYTRTAAPGVPPVFFIVLAMKNNLQHIALDQVQLIKDEKALGLATPAPFKVNYRDFRNQAKERHKVILNIKDDLDILEFVHDGVLLEMTTVHAGILEIMTRLQPGIKEAVEWISPSTAVSLAHMDPLADDRGTNQEQLATLRSNLDTTTMFFAITWSPSHYVQVTAVRTTGIDPWSISYQDSLPQEHQGCRDAAEALLRNLALIAPGDSLPHSQAGAQSDGWSCGLWALKNLEEFLRTRRKEIVQADITLAFLRSRLNFHITKLRPGVPAPAPKALAPSKAKAAKVHATLEDALDAAQQCSKCRPTKLGTKGCQECMGAWFSELRQKRR